MNIIESYQTCFIKKYADFKGKASRSEYWWFWLIYNLMCFGLLILAFIFENPSGGTLYNIGYGALGLSWILGSLGLLCPFLAVSIRRLRDAGYSGWLFLIRFIPYVGVPITWILMMQKSK